MNLVKKANLLIPKPLNIKTVDFMTGNTNDIITSIKKQHIAGWKQTVQFAKAFYSPSIYDILNAIWKFTKKEINYKVDPKGEQFIKTPSVIWAHREGDCKSYSLLIASILQNLKIPYVYRFVSYGPTDNYTHVYIKAGNNLQYTLDCCMDEFNKEKKFTYNKDIDMTKITSISGIDGIGRKMRNPNAPPRKKKGLTLLKNVLMPATLMTDSIIKKNPRLNPKLIGKKVIKKGGKIVKVVERTLGINPHKPLTHGELSLRIARDRTATERDIVASLRGIGSLKVEKYNNRLDVIDDAIEALEYDPTLGDYNPDVALGQIAEDVENGVYSIDEQIYGISGIGKKKAARKEKKEARKAKRAQDRKEGKRPLQKLKKKGALFIKKAGQAAKKLGKNLLKVATAPQRLAVKAMLEVTIPKSAIFFIYLFVTDPKLIAKLPAKAQAKRRKSEKIANFIVNTIGMKRPHFMGIVRNGIMKKYKMSPEAYLSKFMKAKISGLSGISGIHGEYIGVIKEAGEIASGLVQLLNKLMDLFKKKGDKSKGEDTSLDAKDVPDLDGEMTAETQAEKDNLKELSEEVKKQPETSSSMTDAEMREFTQDTIPSQKADGGGGGQYEPVKDGTETKEENDVLPDNGGQGSKGWS
jgi:hypothetical protein